MYRNIKPGEVINIEDLVLTEDERDIFPDTTAEEYEDLFYDLHRCPVDNAPHSICKPEDFR